jgi:tRNA(fMet)-specific endonuclease VapC
MDGISHLLDTNVCVELLRGRGQRILSRLEALAPGTVAVSSVSLGELAFGATLADRHTESVRVAQLVADLRVISFDDAVAWEYGTLRGELTKNGTPIGGLDMMIAATARFYRVILVTHNQREFCRVPGLRLDDWQV